MKMLARYLFIALSAWAMWPTAIVAQTFSPAAVSMFRGLRQQPNDLARYVYLMKLLPQLPASDWPIAMQMLASTEDELGLYNEAIRDFPLKSHVSADIQLPTQSQWKAASAAEAIANLASNRQIVLINEAHHDAHTRQLTLELLPRLRAIGFNYFAAEALLEKDTGLIKRGYPTSASGTEYLREPSYGEIVRQAIKLGYRIIPYDIDEQSQNEREAGQAENLYKKIFAKDPKARLFVHAGYAHIDKSKGRLGSTRPMAMHLRELTGIEPLSIDQTQFREQIPSEPDAYQYLITQFPPDGPTVLLNRATGKPWSANPDMYDINVILPPTGQGAIESGYAQQSTIVHDMVRSQPMLSQHVNTQRPEWLSLRDQRFQVAISTTDCKVSVPCVIDAHYINEPDNAIPADRYTFMEGNSAAKLYLRPGHYRLRAWDVRGKTLSERNIVVGSR
ncbi:MAG: hypothetical protein ABI767_12740 [Rhodanobacter sp.]